MMTDENILEEMLDRATNPAKEVVDELGVQLFCVVVRSNAHLVNKAQQMIMIKIRSSNVTEAIRAIALLEECMTQCGSVFQDEAAKFRFLNELIRLVSKKYQGSDTSFEVKQRIMECLLLWTTEFPNKLKIHEAYDMLSKESGIEHGHIACSLAKRESVLGAIDEEMFAKLIKSNDPDNFKRANLLLQYRMNQDSRRNELFRQHECMLQEVKNTIQLLNQMLGTYNPNDQDQNETMNELYTNCKKHKPMFHHLLELLDQMDSKLIADTLDTNGSLLAVMTRYQELVTLTSISQCHASSLSLLSADTNETAKATTSRGDQIYVPKEPDSVAHGPPILPFSCNLQPGMGTTTRINNDINEFIGTPLQTTNDSGSTKSTNAVAELNDLFDGLNIEAGLSKQQEKKQYPNDWLLLNSTEFLEPDIVNTGALTTTHSIDTLANGVPNPPLSSKKEGISQMSAIDVLSDELFQKILPEQKRMPSFKRDKEKVTLNDLVRERKLGKSKSEDTTLSMHQNFGLPVTLDVSNILKDVETQDDTDIQNIVSVPVDVPVKLDADLTTIASIPTIMPFKHLSDININLDNITPSGEQLIMINDDDIQLILNFTEERPSKHVAVIVISARNKSKNAIKDFQFEASVKKPCKVRVLEPTNDFMAPHKPFRPAVPINQIMLLLNPTGSAVDITCIVGYKLGDDPDPIKESILAKGIPFNA